MAQTYQERKKVRVKKSFWLDPSIAEALSQLANELGKPEVQIIVDLIKTKKGHG
jgi:hypothetical protein